MTVVSVHEAETHLSRLIEQVLAGEEVVIARDAQPVVRLVREGPAEQPAKKPLLGAMKGRFTVDDAFFEPLSEEELSTWHDGKI
ncbi:type II toxin-antitoxin system Phd/YefM family antitoxin [Sphingomonas sp. PAMC 26605]|uniref:type II toxin-antitoxin system Phd/YefM family antitoxin n=1 Tax=Sphingomonas sp. PAMC 26605 TaxID=1112214 RepID=UPI00026CD009|nr:type II toxin-antitoxin system Phd/YefM family antitoxin [Sphingomonas sp. PAMC 26605]